MASRRSSRSFANADGQTPESSVPGGALEVHAGSNNNEDEAGDWRRPRHERRGGFPGGFGGGSSAADLERMREQMQEAQRFLTDAPTSMVMTYADPKLVMTANDGRIRTLFTDKRKQKTSNGNADVQAHWDNNRIVAETTFGSIKVIETYAVDGQQLIVTARMDAPDRGRDRPSPELRRVYDRVVQRE